MKDDQVEAMQGAGRAFVETLRRAHPRLGWRLDDRAQHKPGWKYAEWEQRGVPVRVEIGPKDLDKDQVVLVRRDTGAKEFVPREAAVARIPELLEEIQRALFAKALAFREANTHYVDDYATFRQSLEERGGFYLAHWDGTAETEARVKDETKATIRCIPREGTPEPGACMVTGRPSRRRAVWGRAY
jgi:prolyl-tRNA synthetase